METNTSTVPERRLQSASYSQIVKSSSIVGGSKGLNYVISLISVKALALILGPEGVGLVGLYRSMIGLVSTLAGMGIGQSGVRDVAQASGTQDPISIATTIKTLRRTCWVTGALGCALTIILAYPLSLWTFESGEKTWSIALLGITVLIGSVSVGQLALLQGTRRIMDLARVNVLSASVGTIVAIAIYYVYGQKGIVPALIVSAAINLVFSGMYARRVSVVPVDLSWWNTWKNSKSLLSLGMAFMWSGLLAAVVALVIRAIIVRDLGLDAAGVYTAAWSISGACAGFVLNAMSADFYPRLTAVAHDNDQVNKLVNEQIEIGAFLGLPGLIATITFAPLLMRLFFSEKFLPGAELLPWFVLGVMLQVLGWPLGFVQRAKGATRWIYISTTERQCLELVFSLVFLKYYGLLGIAFAMPLISAIHFMITFQIARHLSCFDYSPDSIRVQMWSFAYDSHCIRGSAMDSWFHRPCRGSGALPWLGRFSAYVASRIALARIIVPFG